ncbi:hypothetical protein K440DRAFT_629861 [Wilcoxina mikolae CBS 423.85]|nr:hypothetical protein K440DRAFT_629861 [Wilcoxina mikolae CBS 423.85]
MVRVGGLMLKPLLSQPLPLRSSYILLSSLQTSSRSSSNPNSNLSSNSKLKVYLWPSVWPCPPIRFH